MQCRIKRPLANLQNIVGDLLYALRDGPAVLRLIRYRPQYQHVESTLEQIGWLRHRSP
jgi:hypothetical protein